MKVRIIEAQTAEHYQWARRLFQLYADALSFDLEFQGFSRELASLPGEYAPPKGCLLLAVCTGGYIGCVALRPLGTSICEMKRLYVVPGWRNRQFGRALAEAIIERARTIGYKRMRLDTIESMTAAQTLYRSLGFRPIKPYRYNPLNDASYFELNLRQ